MPTDLEQQLPRFAEALDREAPAISVDEILSRGNGSDRQLRIFNANRDIVEVVQEIAAATEAVPTAEAAA